MSQGIRKAAIFLTSLPDSQAAELMSKLEPKQAEAVAGEIARLSSVTAAEREATIREFATANPASTAAWANSLEVAEGLVEEALGENTPVAPDEAPPFEFLQMVDNQELLTFIIDEHPQTITRILSYLQPQRAAEIIKCLPSEQQSSVIGRMASMGPISPEIIKDVERGLEHRILKAKVFVPPYSAGGTLTRANNWASGSTKPGNTSPPASESFGPIRVHSCSAV